MVFLVLSLFLIPIAAFSFSSLGIGFGSATENSTFAFSSSFGDVTSAGSAAAGGMVNGVNTVIGPSAAMQTPSVREVREVELEDGIRQVYNNIKKASKTSENATRDSYAERRVAYEDTIIENYNGKHGPRSEEYSHSGESEYYNTDIIPQRPHGVTREAIPLASAHHLLVTSWDGKSSPQPSPVVFSQSSSANIHLRYAATPSPRPSPAPAPGPAS